jgi:hypothetical protein
MSYYDDSSLFVAPNGYKTSVLFAQKPMDANGQLAFTRSNDTATRVGPDGLIQRVRTNLILQSNTFSNASWTNNTLVTANNQISPDGTLDASTFTSDGAYHGVLQSLTITSVPHTFSIYAKAGNYSIFRIVNVSSLTNVAWFNLSTGVTSGAIGGTSKIEAVGNGWFRCSYSTNSPNTSTTNQGFVLSDAMGSLGGVPSGSTMYFWKSQVETGDIATDYIPTTTTAVSVGPVANLPRLNYPINSDGSVGCPSLLLEPQTTALNQFSESFDNAYWQLKTDVTIEANTTDTLDPAGYYGAEKITETATTARHRLASNGTTSSTVNHTASVFMKKGTARYGFVTYAAGTIYTIIVDLEDGTITQTSTSGTIVAQKVEDYGNGWYRISVTGLSGISGSTQYALQFGSAGSAVPSSYVSNIPSFTGSTSNYLYAWGANLTATSYLQSYVPTLGAAVTRGADACSKTGISSLIGQSEGTLFLDFIYKPVFDTTQTSYRASISDGTYAGRVTILAENSNTLSVVITGISLTGSTFPIVDGQRYKVAIGYGATTDVYINGAKVYSYSSGTPTGTYTRFQFSDATGLASRAFAGPINQALLFKTRLSNSELASLTTL